MVIHLLNKLVAIGEDVGRQYVSSFSWLLLDAPDKKQMHSKRIGQFESRRKMTAKKRNLGKFSWFGR